MRAIERERGGQLGERMRFASQQRSKRKFRRSALIVSTWVSRCSARNAFRAEIQRGDWLSRTAERRIAKRREDARDRRGASARATERRARGAGGRKRTYELDILRRREVIAQKLLRREPHGTGDKRSRVFARFLSNKRGNARGDLPPPPRGTSKL